MSSNISISPLTHAAPPSTSESIKKISSASKEFESLLLGQWLQAAETSFGSVPGADDDSDAGDDQMKSFGTQQLAKAITNAGGIGLGNMISKALAHSGTIPTDSQKSDAQFLPRGQTTLS